MSDAAVRAGRTAESDVVHTRIDAGIGWIVIDHAPVNALAQPVRAGLRDALARLDADPDVELIVIRGNARGFAAGADLRELDAPPLDPVLSDVLLMIEASRKTVIAGLTGAALGGGLELALACHYRCAAPDAVLGLPEIKLGLLPGAGGTARLPRWIDAALALEIMLSGDPIPVTRARDIGLVDDITGDDFDADLLSYARASLKARLPPRPAREREIIVGHDFTAALDAQRARSHKSVTPEATTAILATMEKTLAAPFAEALMFARERFAELRGSAVARALRHLFTAERAAGRISNAGAVPAAGVVEEICVIGAGTMGAGIALSAAVRGYRVQLIDSHAAALPAARERIQGILGGEVARGRRSAPECATIMSRLTTSADLASSGTADLVIEAIVEQLEVKRELFRALERYCKPDAVLATNTSTLDVSAIAASTRREASVVGMHFFSPAHVMRLVEIVETPATTKETVATALAVVKRLGKLGVVVGNGFGFVGNRMLYAYGRENQLMLLEGAAPRDIDAALERFGFAMGPNAVGDLTGLDVGYHVRRQRKDLPDDPRYYRVADLLVEHGRLGRKTGCGIYRYANTDRDDRARGEPDAEVTALIAAESTRLGVTQRAIDEAEIVDRCVLALINEAARILAEGIARSAGDVDVIWCNGYGFPRRLGGPLHHADELGAAYILRRIGEWASRPELSYWTPAPLLVELAATGDRFRDLPRARS